MVADEDLHAMTEMKDNGQMGVVDKELHATMKMKDRVLTEICIPQWR